nr:MAG TPA: hypothetical protein [Caudoviricetes sp.]
MGLDTTKALAINQGLCCCCSSVKVLENENHLYSNEDILQGCLKGECSTHFSQYYYTSLPAIICHNFP